MQSSNGRNGYVVLKTDAQGNVTYGFSDVEETAREQAFAAVKDGAVSAVVVQGFLVVPKEK
jgi:hypothetical protein